MTLPCSRCCSVLIIWRALHPNLDHQRSLGQGRHGSRLSDIGVHEASAASSMCFDGKQLILYLLGLTQTWTWLESRWVQWQDMGPPHAWALRLLVISNGSAQSCSAPAAFGRPPQAQQSPETWVLRHFLSAAGGQPG